MKTIHEFITSHSDIGFAFKRSTDNPNMDDMPNGSFHFLITLSRGKETMVIPYSMGPGLAEKPKNRFA